MQIETARLILRPWEDADAPALFRVARDPEVGPRAGWAAHRDVDESLRIIRTVLGMPETYAVVPKGHEGSAPIGSVGLMIGEASSLARNGREAELGYWLGRDYWGRGLTPEAAGALVDHAFRDLRLEVVWAGYYDGNEQSRRVQQKLGLSPSHVHVAQTPRPIDGCTRVYVTRITREEWGLARHRASGR